MKIVWSPTAVNDLKQARHYIAEGNPAAAEEVAKKIITSIERLIDFPNSGRPGRVPNTRELVIDGTPFIIPYTVKEHVIQLISVLHQSRKWPVT